MEKRRAVWQYPGMSGSKKYRNRTCGYCAEPSTCRDHVIARQFFLERDRGNLPQVPSCDECNREKAALEHYLASVLPFGGRHAGGLENLREMVPKRLARNAPLRKELRLAQRRVWSQESGDLMVPVTGLNVDHEKVLALYRWIARGLMFFHWHVRLTDAHDVTALALTRAGEEAFDRLLGARNVRARVSENLKSGTFCYESAQAAENPSMTAWRFTMYGGLQFVDPNIPGATSKRIGVVTGPRSIRLNAQRAIRFGIRQV